MAFPYFWHNGELLPTEQATVPLSRLEYSYGFGVYESIRVNKGTVFFLEEHCERLMESAKTIGLDHNFSPDFVRKCVTDLIAQNRVEACNVKVLLIGAPAAEEATLDILCLNPLFPSRQLYKDGATCITFKYEREYPAAKTLNMLSSYLAFRQAKAAGAYDALLINRLGCITEGTRTNFFALKGRVLISPPSSQVLLGVTRQNVLKVAQKTGLELVEQDIPLLELPNYDGAFITSTSSKVLPLQKIDEYNFDPALPAIRQLMQDFDKYLISYSS